MYAVVDRCVLVSGLRSDTGAIYKILQTIRFGELRIAISVALAIEYESVARLPGLVPKLTSNEIQNVVDVLCCLAHQQKIFYTWRPFLPDSDDDLVMEVAAAAGYPFIITHNIKDFRGSDSMGIDAITPGQALNLI